MRYLHHQGVYLHDGQGRMEAHERWGDSNPGPEVWEAWGRGGAGRASGEEREIVGRFVGCHFVGEG